MTVRIQKPAVNIREKLAELERPIGINGQALMATDTPQQAFDLLGAGRRNLIINGDFKVSQRGDYTTSAVTAGHDTYWLDRWMSLKDGTTSTVQRVTRTINGVSKYASRIECTSAGSGIMGFSQRVELSSIPVGRTLTVSAWVRTNQPYVGFRTNTFQGSGGDRGVKVTPNESWQRIYWTFNSTGTVNSAPDILIVAYNNAPVSIAVGNYIEIAEVQLEVGKVATPFEYRSYGEELALCQRYYYKDLIRYGRLSKLRTASLLLAQFDLPVSMRDSNSISLSTYNYWAYFDGNSPTVSGLNSGGANGARAHVLLTVTSNGTADKIAFWASGEGDLIIDSEL